jgi:hypothetical protein
MADSRFVPLLSRGDRSAEGYQPMGTAGNDVEVGAGEPPLPPPAPAPQTNKASHVEVPGSAVFASAPADEPLSWPSWVFIAFIVVAGVLASIASGSPGPVFIVYVVAVAPGVLVFMLIAYRLRDPIVSKSFLVGQVFIGAVPGIILVFIVGAYGLALHKMSHSKRFWFDAITDRYVHGLLYAPALYSLGFLLRRIF